MLITSFEPIVNEDSKILILGSMPGKESLERQEYYGNRRNSFWKIIFELFNGEYIDDYSSKIDFIQSHNIALWDVIHKCERKSSLDSDIRKASINDFESFFEDYDIKYIFINGSKAYDLLTKKVDPKVLEGRNIIKLDSTSPARAIPYVKKLENWSQICKCLKG